MLLGYLSLLAVEYVGGLLVLGAGSHMSTSGLMLAGEVVTFAAGIIAGAITARVAVARPLLHAAVLGVVIVCVTAFIAAFSKRPLTPGVPGWFPYAAALLTGAGAFVGGAIATREKRAP